MSCMYSHPSPSPCPSPCPSPSYSNSGSSLAEVDVILDENDESIKYLNQHFPHLIQNEKCKEYLATVSRKDRLQFYLLSENHNEKVSMPWNQDQGEDMIIALIDSMGLEFVQRRDKNDKSLIQSLILANGSMNLINKVLEVRSDDGGNEMILHPELYCVFCDGTPEEILNKLIEVGGKDFITNETSDQDSILHVALYENNLTSYSIISKLIDMGGKELVMRPQRYGLKTALHLACQYNASTEIIHKLVDVGGRELVLNNGCKFNALHSALLKDSTCDKFNGDVPFDVLTKLIEIGGEDIVYSTHDGWDKVSTLSVACYFNQPLHIIEKLAQVGGVKLITQVDEDGDNVLQYLCKSDKPSIEVFELLIQLGGKWLWHCTNSHGHETLFHVIQSIKDDSQYFKFFAKFLKLGGRKILHLKDNDGNNALYSACRFPSCNVGRIEKLINLGGKNLLMNTNHKNESALHSACTHGNSVDVIRSLIEYGGRDLVMLTDINNCSALHRSCSCRGEGSIAITDMLVEVGGEGLVMMESKHGKKTALHVLCQQIEADCQRINKLIEVGSRKLVMKEDCVGSTALHYAVGNHFPLAAVEKLVELGGADVVLKRNYFGQDPLQYTIVNNVHMWRGMPSLSLITLLLDVGGKQILCPVEKGECSTIHKFLHFRMQYSETKWTENDRKEHELVVLKIIQKGLQYKIGGEFGIGGLFDPTPAQNTFILRMLVDLCIPMLKLNPTIVASEPILHAAIIHNMPGSTLSSIITSIGCCLKIKDSIGNYPIDVAIEKGIKWDDGLGLIVEALAVQEQQPILHIAAIHGVQWRNGMEELVEDDENDIDTIDESTGFFPCMLAAIGKSNDLDSIYELTRRSPDVVKKYSRVDHNGSVADTSKQLPKAKKIRVE